MPGSNRVRAHVLQVWLTVYRAFQHWPEEGSVASGLGQVVWVVVCGADLGCGRWACSPPRDRPVLALHSAAC